jgi:hypothetical protein
MAPGTGRRLCLGLLLRRNSRFVQSVPSVSKGPEKRGGKRRLAFASSADCILRRDAHASGRLDERLLLLLGGQVLLCEYRRERAELSVRFLIRTGGEEQRG